MSYTRAVFGTVLAFGFFSLFFLRIPNEAACAVKKEVRTVKGESLDGIIAPGADVTLLRNYYDCHKVERGDIVAYDFSGNEDPLVKRALGLPGDRFAVKNGSGGAKGIFINGIELRTTRAAPYSLTENVARILELYERDYGGTIPADAYLILGNLPQGTVDSTQFGLVSGDDLIGKIVYSVK